MNTVHEAIALGESTLLNLRKILTRLRTGQAVQPVELEVVLCRAVIDLAGVMDYAGFLEIQLNGLNEKDRGVQSVG